MLARAHLEVSKESARGNGKKRSPYQAQSGIGEGKFLRDKQEKSPEEQQERGDRVNQRKGESDVESKQEVGDRREVEKG
jgi:hypothetical protein